MTSKLTKTRIAMHQSIKGQKDMRRTNRALKRERDTACTLLREILKNSTAFDSALEIDSHGAFSGFEWAQRVSNFLDNLEAEEA